MPKLKRLGPVKDIPLTRIPNMFDPNSKAYNSSLNFRLSESRQREIREAFLIPFLEKQPPEPSGEKEDEEEIKEISFKVEKRFDRN